MVLLVFITSKSELLTLPWSWSISACIRSGFFLSSSPAKVSSLIVRSDLRRFLQMFPLRLLSASNSDSNSLMRVSILIMALRPPFSALTSASSARAPASLHWASRSFLSSSRFIATSCSQRSSSASLAASTIALAALSSESLASLLISSKSAPSWLNSDSSFLLAAAIDWLTFPRSVKTGAVGERLKEGSNINKSLTTLGLVISKLAEQSGAKGKDKFVPYRDSTLTWLLKDNLGGNSRTVMIATLSPSMDNYEETLSTLRYADRAKKIVNHAVVNEDPNARIIRELRAEVDALKEMLLHAAQPEVLKEKLCENEKLMKEMSLTWEEKLEKTEQKQEDRRHALEKMGISVQSSGIKVEKNKYFLVNLNADPSLNELLVYYLKDRNLVGRSDAANPQDIQLSGLGIHAEHCVIEVVDKELWISPLVGARTCVNGRDIVEQTQLRSGDRILWGYNHFFRVNCPKPSVEASAASPKKPFDWRMAQEEVMMADSESSSMKEAIA